MIRLQRGQKLGYVMPQKHKEAIGKAKANINKEHYQHIKDLFYGQWEFHQQGKNAAKKLAFEISLLDCSVHRQGTIFMCMTGHSRRTYSKMLNK
jgi:hypothetical protein